MVLTLIFLKQREERVEATASVICFALALGLRTSMRVLMFMCVFGVGLVGIPHE